MSTLFFQHIVPPYGGASDSEIIEELGTGKLSPRVSMSATEDDPPSGSNTPKRKFSKFNIGEKFILDLSPVNPVMEDTPNQNFWCNSSSSISRVIRT